MNHQDLQASLNPYLDGNLNASAESQVESHLSDCASCRQHLAALRQVQQRAAHLPSSIEPGRDLWPQIAARLPEADAPSPAQRPQTKQRRANWRPLAVAAGVALVVLSSITTYKLTGIGPRQEPQPSPGLALTVEEASGDYSAALAELAKNLEERRDQLSPQTIEVIEKNLAIIDAAIAESRQALAADPANKALLLAIIAMYEGKVDLLQRLTHMPEEL